MVLPDVNPHEMSEKRFQLGCVGRFSKALIEGAAGGVVIGYAMLAWYPDPYRYTYKGQEVFKPLDFRYVLRNLRAPVVYSSLVCAAYSGVECTVENLRDESKSSTWVNAFAGGAAAGVILGSLSNRFDIMSTSALGVGLMMAMVEYNSHFIAAEQGTISDNRGPSVAELKERYPKFKEL
mmetsp:Transcript_6164/g.12350  ORF Transcript_6164/g.12350 Transcript_6164/m.12350 type:complete len:179 (-) Transcript_6164:89-625(-)|eukprot:scaffold32703_cov153-Amphora_coffeaeformis.AAC.4